MPFEEEDEVMTGDAEADETIRRVLRSNCDMRREVLKRMAEYTRKVTWTIAGATARVLLDLCGDICASGKSFTEWAEKFVDDTGLRGHHLGDEVLLHCAVLDTVNSFVVQQVQTRRSRSGLADRAALHDACASSGAAERRVRWCVRAVMMDDDMDDDG